MLKILKDHDKRKMPRVKVTKCIGLVMATKGGDAGRAPRRELETSGFLVNQGINYMTNDSTPSNEIVLETWALPITVLLAVVAYIRNVYYKILMTVFLTSFKRGGQTHV